jgi:hypothetical protein
MNITPEVQSFLWGIVVGNGSLIVGFLVSLKVSIAVLDQRVGRTEKDINGIGAKVRTNTNKEEVENG